MFESQPYENPKFINALLEEAEEKGHLTAQIIRAQIAEFDDVRAEHFDQIIVMLSKFDIDYRTNSSNPTKIVNTTLQDDLTGIDAVDTIGLYLKEMSRVPLLSVNEEIQLAQEYEAGQVAQQQLLQLAKADNNTQKDNLKQLIYRGEAARDHLIRANTRLVVSVAKRYVNRGVPFLDLIQEGNLGLMRAVEKFDYHRGYRFSTYATWWIRQAVSRAIADQGRTIRVPVHMSDQIAKLYKTAGKLEQKLGRKATYQELAEELEVNEEKVQWMMRVSWQPLSLEEPIGEDEDAELGAFIEDKNATAPSDVLQNQLLKEQLEETLATLTIREAKILRMRFGLNNGEIHTLEEVGKKFGLTRERIRQIEGNALRRLRHPSRSRELRAYLPDKY